MSIKLWVVFEGICLAADGRVVGDKTLLVSHHASGLSVTLGLPSLRLQEVKLKPLREALGSW